MTSLLERLRAQRDQIMQVAARRGAHNVRIFGSVARGEDDGKSDVDFLVDLEPERTLLDLGGLLMDLEDLFGCEVFVTTEDGLKERIRGNVLKEAVAL